jgi:hypothetical protein
MTNKRNNVQKEISGNENPEVFGISKENGTYKLTRRDFSKMVAIASAAIAIASCDVPKPTEEIIPTATEKPTNTPKPTSTKTPTQRPPTATPVINYATVNADGINFRTGPGTIYPSIGKLYKNVEVIVIGQNQDASWYKVLVGIADLPDLVGAPITQNGTVDQFEGWIKASLLDALGDASFANLPIEEAPPTPTPLPSQKPTGDEGISYEYTDIYGHTSTYTLPCNSPIPEGAICVCNCVSLCSCVSYVAPTCDCVAYSSEVCYCNLVSYWYPN